LNIIGRQYNQPQHKLFPFTNSYSKLDCFPPVHSGLNVAVNVILATK